MQRYCKLWLLSEMNACVIVLCVRFIQLSYRFCNNGFVEQNQETNMGFLKYAVEDIKKEKEKKKKKTHVDVGPLSKLTQYYSMYAYWFNTSSNTTILHHEHSHEQSHQLSCS